MSSCRCQKAIAFAAALSPPALLLAANNATQTSVYLCTTPQHAVEYSQFPCARGSDEESLIIEDRKIGWTPAPTEQGTGTQAVDTPQKHEKRSPIKADSSRLRREEQCWKKHALLEDVNWRLRRGYTAKQGTKLRRKRQTYEDYIAHYCR